MCYHEINTSHEGSIMSKALLSIKGHNAFGNIGAGVCLVALGIALSFGGKSIASVLCAICLLVVAGVSLFACLSRRHEPHDEMSDAHDGRASSFALKTTLIVLGVVCCVGLITGAAFNLAAACCLAIGLALLLYGCAFAWHERG